MKRRFYSKTMQECYDVCRRLAADPDSEFYHAGKPRTGALHRNAYWVGRAGLRCTWTPGTPAYACWRAGADDLKDADGKLPELPRWVADQLPAA